MSLKDRLLIAQSALQYFLLLFSWCISAFYSLNQISKDVYIFFSFFTAVSLTWMVKKLCSQNLLFFYFLSNILLRNFSRRIAKVNDNFWLYQLVILIAISFALTKLLKNNLLYSQNLFRLFIQNFLFV